MPGPTPVPPFPPPPPTITGPTIAGDGAPVRRSRGTVYGGGASVAVIDTNQAEQTGSLTGRILRYGRPETEADGNNTRVVMIMLVVLVVAVLVTVFAIT